MSKSKAKDLQTKENKLSVLRVFEELLKEKRMLPSRSEMIRAGVSRDRIRGAFGNMEGLKQAAKKWKPSLFKNIIDGSIFNSEMIEDIKSKIGDFSKLVITTAVAGARVHEGFLSSLKLYCKKNKAMLLILPCADPASSPGMELDGVLAGEHIVFDDIALNDNVFISAIKLSAKQINPLTGLSYLAQAQGSFIYASPKQFLEYESVGNSKIPRALMTTGAVTVPNYETDIYMAERTAYIAKKHHKLGAVIVEIDNDREFHFTQVQAEYGSGFFIDRGIYYKGSEKKTEKVRPAAIVPGDWHCGATNSMVREVTFQMIKDLKPKKFIAHDFFNGLSINRHESFNKIKKAIRFENNELGLQEELKITADEINKISSMVDELVIVKSNHDQFLDRYLSDGMYLTDQQNFRIAHELVGAVMDGKDALRFGVEKFGIKKPNSIKWLGINEDYFIADIQHGVHGHLGRNGHRNPSNRALERAYGAITAGHSHTPGILRDVFRVGTSTDLREGYNDGASTWMHTHCLVYDNGSRQLINIFNGKYRG